MEDLELFEIVAINLEEETLDYIKSKGLIIPDHLIFVLNCFTYTTSMILLNELTKNKFARNENSILLNLASQNCDYLPSLTFDKKFYKENFIFQSNLIEELYVQFAADLEHFKDPKNFTDLMFRLCDDFKGEQLTVLGLKAKVLPVDFFTSLFLHPYCVIHPRHRDILTNHLKDHMSNFDYKALLELLRIRFNKLIVNTPE